MEMYGRSGILMKVQLMDSSVRSRVRVVSWQALSPARVSGRSTPFWSIRPMDIGMSMGSLAGCPGVPGIICEACTV